jgi:hypothetical protein
MEIKVDNIVKVKSSLDVDEINSVYRVIEINDERCIIELFNTNMVIRPQSVAIVSRLELLQDTRNEHE